MGISPRLAGTATAVVGLSGALLFSAPSPASAAPAALYAPSALVLTVSHPGDSADSAARAVTLSCAPQATGTHPAAAEACAELRGADGKPEALLVSESTRACTKIWSPVTVTIDGVWQGVRTSWKHTFANSCEMNGAVSHSSVFSF
ncbi:subtilase-type protease inhibitor [Streptomyces massasporeus]|uniref:subtilase-type protease inhibitor n=1 Tax=Streptomyces massasporeus TaxID=67324 RepID=UPI0038145BD3